MRVMVDSTNITDDPNTAQLVAYYVDGIYATTESAVKARFPNAIPVGISAVGSNAGIVGDVEPGCMTVLGGVIWVLLRRKAGLDPTLYCNEENTWPALRQAFISQGIPEPHYGVANYDGIAVIPAGAVFKQYANSTLTGGHFDKSVVADFWPGVDGVFGPGAGSLGDKDLRTFFREPASQAIYFIGPEGKRKLSQDEWNIYALAGDAYTNTSTAVLAEIPDIATPTTVDLSSVLSKLAEIEAKLDAAGKAL